MEPSQFLKGRTRETKIRRDAAGRWFNDGDPIDHPQFGPLVCPMGGSR